MISEKTIKFLKDELEKVNNQIRYNKEEFDWLSARRLALEEVFQSTSEPATIPKKNSWGIIHVSSQRMVIKTKMIMGTIVYNLGTIPIVSDDEFKVRQVAAEMTKQYDDPFECIEVI